MENPPARVGLSREVSAQQDAGLVQTWQEGWYRATTGQRASWERGREGRAAPWDASLVTTAQRERYSRQGEGDRNLCPGPGVVGRKAASG